MSLQFVTHDVRLSPLEAAALGEAVYTLPGYFHPPRAEFVPPLRVRDLLAQRPLAAFLKRLARRACLKSPERPAGLERRPLRHTLLRRWPVLRVPLDELMAAWVLLNEHQPSAPAPLFLAAWTKLDAAALQARHRWKIAP